MLICSNRGVLSEHRLHYKGVAQGWGDTDAHEQSCERESSQSGLAIAALALCKPCCRNRCKRAGSSKDCPRLPVQEVGLVRVSAVGIA